MKPSILLQRANAARPFEVDSYIGQNTPRARAHHNHAVGHRYRFCQVMSDKYNRAALFTPQSEQQIFELQLGLRVQGPERLVHQQDGRIQGKGARQSATLTHAVGQRLGVLVHEIAQANALWLHVDSAMAGSAMILPECRWMWDGIELADSVVVNAHKWLGVAFDCSIYYVRDPQHLIRVMSTNPSYLQSAVDGEVKNLREARSGRQRR